MGQLDGLLALLATIWLLLVILPSVLRGITDVGVGLVPVEPRPPDPADIGSVEPARAGTPAAVVQDNILYHAGGLTPIDCPAPPVADNSAGSQWTYHDGVLGCLIDTWAPLLERVGLEPGNPQLFVFSEEGSGPCGTFAPISARILAFYCPANNMIYIDAEFVGRALPPEHHIAWGLLLAHEYGHHAQEVAGILAAQARLGYEQPDRRLELSRRTETQASCFAGMFVSAVAATYPVEGVQREAFDHYASRAFGDEAGAPPTERTHGTPQTHGVWIVRGFEHNDPATCNSYVVPAADVD